MRKLTLERINELKEEIEKDQEQLDNLKKNISLLKNDNLSETDMKIIEHQMIEQLKQKEKDEEAHQLWLKERDEKHESLKRKKSFGFMKTPRKDDQLTPSTPIKSAASSTVTTPNQEELQINEITPLTSNKNVQDELQAKLIKQENLMQDASEQVRARDKTKDDKVQIIVINEDKQQNENQTADRSIELREDRVVTKQQANKELTNKDRADRIEITVVKPVVKMEIESSNAEKNAIKDDCNEKLIEAKDDNKEEQEKNKEQSDSIANNKRKRTSTSVSSNVSTSSSGNVQQQQHQQPQPQLQPQTTQTTTTRRSGRIKPLRSSTSLNTSSTIISSAIGTPTPIAASPATTNTPTVTKSEPLTIEQQQKRTQIDESNIIVPINASQLILNDDSTKDSTTSDITDTYTSPNSPASSILNIDPSDPEQAKEQKEFKAWKKSILLVWRQAATHKYSSLFTQPVTDEEAKGYSTVVYRPIDLTMIKKRIENGQVRTTNEFQRDIMLMFQNAIMYNSIKHEVFQMTGEMQKEVLESIEDFINDQKSSTSSTTATVAVTTTTTTTTTATSATKEILSTLRRKSRTLS